MYEIIKTNRAIGIISLRADFYAIVEAIRTPGVRTCEGNLAIRQMSLSKFASDAVFPEVFCYVKQRIAAMQKIHDKYELPGLMLQLMQLVFQLSTCSFSLPYSVSAK